MVHPTTQSFHLLETTLRQDRKVVSIILISVITVCWIYLLAGAGTDMYPHEMAMLVPPQQSMQTTMPSMNHSMMTPVSWTSGYALLMFSMWWFMMIAMMLPSAAPMVLLHAAIFRKSVTQENDAKTQVNSRQLHLASATFISGYLVMWGMFSLIAVIVQWELERQQLLSAMMMPTNQLLGSVLLLAAGIWQLTPFKTTCLRHCRTPIHFLSSHWRSGTAGAFRIGIEHGLYCLGCCWFLMALLFFGGVMNLVWIIGLAVFVLLEKMIPAGVVFGRVTGVLLIAWGGWLGFIYF